MGALPGLGLGAIQGQGCTLDRRSHPSPGSSIPLSLTNLLRQTAAQRSPDVTATKHFKPSALFTAQSGETCKHRLQVGKMNNI